MFSQDPVLFTFLRCLASSRAPPSDASARHQGCLSGEYDTRVVTRTVPSLERCAAVCTQRVRPPLIFRKRASRSSSSTFGWTVLPTLQQVPIFRPTDLIQVPTSKDPPRVFKISPRSSTHARLVAFLSLRRACDLRHRLPQGARASTWMGVTPVHDTCSKRFGIVLTGRLYAHAEVLLWCSGAVEPPVQEPQELDPPRS